MNLRTRYRILFNGEQYKIQYQTFKLTLFGHWKRKWVIDVKTISTRLLFPKWATKTFWAIGWAFPLLQYLANIKPIYWEFFGLPCIEIEWTAYKK